MTTTHECKNHEAIRSHDRPYLTTINEHRAADGCICVRETCECGATRDQNFNGRHASGWTRWTDSDVCWWAEQNVDAIRRACSDRSMAGEWVRVILDAARNREELDRLESVRETIRAGKPLTLYAAARV